jgi:recombination DNA repair RAD52 pathway protein
MQATISIAPAKIAHAEEAFDYIPKHMFYLNVRTPSPSARNTSDITTSIPGNLSLPMRKPPHIYVIS